MPEPRESWQTEAPQSQSFSDSAASSSSASAGDKSKKSFHDNINDASRNIGEIVRTLFVWGSYITGAAVFVTLGVYGTLWFHRPVYTSNDFQSSEGLNPSQAQNLNELIRVCNVQTGTPSVCRALYIHGNVTAVYEREQYPPKEQG